MQGRYLSFTEREEIALVRAGGESMRQIAARLGRSPSTISRELARNRVPGSYRASAAHAPAYHRASRPKPAKLVTNPVLREKVERYLEKKYSPEQIAGRLRVEFVDQPEMWVSHETIYQQVHVAADIDIFFCDPHAPWQRAINENANGLLRWRLRTCAR